MEILGTVACEHNGLKMQDPSRRSQRVVWLTNDADRPSSGRRKRLELSQTVAIWFFNKVDATREESQGRERPENCRRRRSNRPGNSQAKGPSSSLKSGKRRRARHSSRLPPKE